jgi:hypothetical protein
MSELKKMTRMGSDARRLAALLQAKAPKGHMLAYINPREAALLKEHGGSGEPHADTGIPSFDDGMDTGGFEGLTQGQVDTAAQQQDAHNAHPVTESLAKKTAGNTQTILKDTKHA